MKDLGPLNYFLGIVVTRHKGGMFLSQRKYAEEIIDRAGMSSWKSSPTPVDTNAKVGATSSASCEDPTLYRSLAGALQYLTLTRPDISYTVQQVCLYMHDLRVDHMQALKHVIRYLQVHLILVFISIHLRSHLLFLILMLIGVGALIRDVLPWVTVCFWVTTWCHGPPSVNLHSLGLMQRPSIRVLLM